MTAALLPIGGGRPGWLRASPGRVYPPGRGVVYIKGRARSADPSARHLRCECCLRVVATRVVPYARAVDDRKALVEVDGMTYEVNDGAGLMETVRAVGDIIQPIHLRVDGRTYDCFSRDVLACSDECERWVLHAAGLDPDGAGLRP